MPKGPTNNARGSSDQPTDFERWPFWRRWFGQRSERYAAKFLRKRGYHILAANISDAQGEIDLLAVDPTRTLLIVVEVRSTSDHDPNKAAITVNFLKQKKLSEAITRFLQRKRMLGKVTVRFDILAIAWPAGVSEPTVLHIENAFESTGRWQMFS